MFSYLKMCVDEYLTYYFLLFDKLAQVILILQMNIRPGIFQKEILIPTTVLDKGDPLIIAMDCSMGLTNMDPAI